MRALRSQQGSTVVEFALIVPVFCFLALSTASVGRALYQYNTLTKQVRVAGQYLAKNCRASSPVCTTTAYEATAKNLVLYGNPAGTGNTLLAGMAATDVTITTQPAGAPTYVTVTAQYALPDIFGHLITIPGIGSVKQPGTVTATMKMAAL